MSSQGACYLTHDEANAGTLYMRWSHTPLNNAIAMFTSGKTVPGFKFKQNGGKSEVIRGCGGGVGIRNYYRGLCEFAKTARSFIKDGQGEFTLLQEAIPNPVAVYTTIQRTGDVARCRVGEPTSLASAVAVAAVHSLSSCFNLKRLHKPTFLMTGASTGYSLEMS